jgi:hypothetical protein
VVTGPQEEHGLCWPRDRCGARGVALLVIVGGPTAFEV